MRIAVTGASGMLGSALLKELSKTHKIFACSRNLSYSNKNIYWSQFDLINKTKLEDWICQSKPDILIYCAAIVNLELCETQKDLAKNIHFDSILKIIDIIKKTHMKLIYISSDGVFNGQKTGKYTELDDVDPLNVYAKTKILGEEAVLGYDHGMVLRTNILGDKENSFSSWLIDSLKLEKELNLFSDVFFSPIHVSRLAKIINLIIERQRFGLYHCSSRESISKYSFGILLAKELHFSYQKIKSIQLSQINSNLIRPRNMALDVTKFEKDFEITLPNISDCVMSIKESFNLK